MANAELKSNHDDGIEHPYALLAGLFGLVALVSFSILDFNGALASCCLGFMMAAIAVSDARHFIVPDALSLPAIPLGLIATGLIAEPPGLAILTHMATAFLGAAALYGIRFAYSAVRRREGLGLGDVKLAAVAGAWTGPEGLSLVLLFACGSALTFVLIRHLQARHPINASTALPFGAFLAPSIWFVWCLLMVTPDLN